MSETFGDTPGDDAADKPFLMAVPLKAVNEIEHELSGKFAEEMQQHDAPTSFYDGETGELENGDDYVARYGRPLSLDEVLVVRELIHDDVIERYRLQIITARELGPKATIEQYRAACALQNIEPLI